MRRLRSVTGVAVAVLAAAPLATGCGGDTAKTGPPTRGGTIHLADTAEATSLDPTTALDNPSIRVLTQIVEPLFKTNAKGAVEPWLVTSTKRSADHRTWTLGLREGVRFSDGKPLTAADVAFSLDAVRKSANWSPMFEAITRVRATSPSTVVIRTRKPVAKLESELSLFAAGIVPNDYGGVSQKQFGQRPIGTGPFKLGRWVRGRSLTLERNARYWQPDRPRLDRVVVDAVPDDNSRASQLRGGQLDVMAAPAWSQLDSLERAPGVRVGTYALGYLDYLSVNVRKPLFRDPGVREAVTLALDRDAIVKAATSGQGKPAGSFFMPALQYHDPSIKPPARDVARAKQLLAAAVEARGVSPTMTLLLFAGDTYYRTAAQVIQDDLQEVGFKVTLQPLDESTLISRISAGKFDATLLYFSSDIVDPSEAASLYVSTGAGFTGMDATQVNKLARVASGELDEAKRRQLYLEIQALIAKPNAVITYDYRPFVWAMRDKVVGFELNLTGIPWLADAGLSG